MNDNVSIRQVVRTTAYDEALAARLGMNPTDLRCLELVAGEPGLAPGRLAELAGLTSGAITGVLDRLERQGDVTRRPDPADRRRIAVHPVKRHLAVLSAAVAPLDAAIDSVLGAYAEDERVTIAAFLRSAAEAVGAETERLVAETHGEFRGQYVPGAPRWRQPRPAHLSVRRAKSRGQHRSARPARGGTGHHGDERLTLELVAGAPAGQLLAASFDGPKPDVRAMAGNVNVHYRRQSAAIFRSRRARIALSTEVRWAIELDGGLTDLTGDLGGVHLTRLDVEGGANHVDLSLPRPQGTVVVRLAGVASSVVFRRPAEIPGGCPGRGRGLAPLCGWPALRPGRRQATLCRARLRLGARSLRARVPWWRQQRQDHCGLMKPGGLRPPHRRR